MASVSVKTITDLDELTTLNPDCHVMISDGIKSYKYDANKFGQGGGGGGSSSGVYVDELIYDTYTVTNGTYNLTKSIDNYDALLICGYGSSGDSTSNFIVSQFVTKSEFFKKHTLLATVESATRRVFISFPDSTHVEVSSIEGDISLRYIYGIKMSGDYFSPIIYSTEEREVGVWKDNKPLYQKTFIKTITNIADYIDLVDMDDIDTMVSIDGITRYADANFNQAIKVPYHHNGSNYIRIYYVSNGLNALGGSYPDNQILFLETTTDSLEYYNDIVFTIQYTKTTDTAGSGSYNTLRVPTHHYSTEEQVIGTWIDGSTLYEKTFIGLSQATNGSDWVTIQGVNIPSIKDVIDCKAWALGGNDEQIAVALAEYSAVGSDGVRVTVFSSSWDRTITKVTIQYTKAS